MTVFAIFQIKGGVGKTATAVNLSYCSATLGSRSLLWDVDPQGAATYYFRVKPKIKGGGEKLFRNKAGAEKFIKGSDFEYLDVIPADFSYRNMDLFLGDHKKRTQRFDKFLSPLKEEYENIFLDCPPSMSLVSENVLRASDVLLVPVIPTTLSLRTLEQVTEFCQSRRFKNLKIMPFFSMMDRRRKLHRDIVSSLHEQYPEVLQTAIPNSSFVEQMGVHRSPVGEFSPKSAPAKAYHALFEEVKMRLEG